MKYLILAITMIAAQPALAWFGGNADSTNIAHGASVGQFLQPIAPPPPAPPAPAGTIDRATITWIENNCRATTANVTGYFYIAEVIRCRQEGEPKAGFLYRISVPDTFGQR